MLLPFAPTPRACVATRSPGVGLVAWGGCLASPRVGDSLLEGIASTTGHWVEGLSVMPQGVWCLLGTLALGGGWCQGTEPLWRSVAWRGHSGACCMYWAWSGSLPLHLLLHGGFHAPGRRRKPLCYKGLLCDLVPLLTFAPAFPSLRSRR